jgi:hypothetical protein
MPYGIHALSAWGDQRRIAYVRVLGHGASGAPVMRKWNEFHDFLLWPSPDGNERLDQPDSSDRMPP